MSARRLHSAILLVLIGLAACTSSPAQSSQTPHASSQSTSSPSPVGPITPGEFRYQNAGLDVALTLKTNTGAMVVDNGSGHDLGRPDLYVLDGTNGKRIDGKVLQAAPIPDGDKATFRVEFPPEVNDKELGLVILLFGADNYGAFAPA